MKTVAYKCLSCQYRFKKSVISIEEARDAVTKGQAVVPVICPECKSQNVAYDDE